MEYTRRVDRGIGRYLGRSKGFEIPLVKTYVVAVSGGVDSVVLLDALARRQTIAGVDPWRGTAPGELVVAHFDHGIRDDSAEDAVFVRELAQQYGLVYESVREELGADASEELARTRRYVFLADVCRRHHGRVVTAHHANDVAESIAINITRGTGWLGLAVMNTALIVRPLLGVSKREILAYAHENGLKWREDSTNASDAYLRNRIRKKGIDDDVVWQLAALRARQCRLQAEISMEIDRLETVPPYSRYFLSHCGDVAADEVLKHILLYETGNGQTGPTRARLLHAIKTARHGTHTPISGGAKMVFTARDFIVEMSR